MAEDHDPWLDLCERFAARGVTLKTGNMKVDMIKHLLDSQEEAEVRLRGLEDKMLKMRADLGG